MILTVTLNPAIDKILVLNNFKVHKLHRLKEKDLSMAVPGGKGVNIAMGLKALGNDVIATGFAGGYTGHLLCDSLRQKDITTSFVFTEGITRTNTSILDKDKETLTEINDIGEEIQSDDLEFFLENYHHLLHRSKIVVIAGSLPQGVPVDIYARMIKEAKQLGRKVIVHTSPEYFNEVVSTCPFLCNPDMRSQHELMGRPLDGIKNFLNVGNKILVQNKDTEFVVFTHRIENVVALTRQNSYILRPLNLKIINMLGYADAYLAGFIHAYLQGQSVKETLLFASACGLTNVESVYKEVHDINLINKNIERIELEEVD